MKKLLLIIFFIPVLALAQSIQIGDSIYYPYSNHTEFKYLKNVDSITSKIFDSIKLNNIQLQYSYIENNEKEKYENYIITNYWTNSNVKFNFKNDNFSYLTSTKFDNFRRSFYKDKDLNILVYLKENDSLISKLNTIKFNDFIIGVFKDENFISVSFFDSKNDRILQIFYYFENKKIIKIEIKELNAQFSWDIVNYYIYYFKNEILIFDNFYQTLMDARFSLEMKYDKYYLLDLSEKILKEIEK